MTGSAPTREQLVDELQRLHEAMARVPNLVDMDRRGRYSGETYREEFGSWRMALVRAEVVSFEFPDTGSSSAKYSDEELINEIWKIADLRGLPSSRDMEYGGGISTTTYSYRYGSWNQALEAAGFDPREPHTEGRGQPKALKHYTSADWKELREQALERDGYECRRCGLSEDEQQKQYDTGLNVHHIRDVADHDDPENADTLENLETLCSACHGKEHPFAKS